MKAEFKKLIWFIFNGGLVIITSALPLIILQLIHIA